MRILVVEDEERLADTLSDILTEQNYTVDISYDGEDGADNAMSGIYDAVIMDVMLPKLNGFDAVKKLRQSGNSTPVLILTAKNEITDKVTGLDCGADYYLTKPFERDELLACIRSLLRRQSEFIQEKLSFADISLDLKTCILECGDRHIRLSSKEFEIMRIFMINKESIVSKESIITKVWGFESDAEDNHVEVYVSFLRKKLTHIKSAVKIEALRGIGYHLEGVL
jgi:DNA-binding response OmpR family regulator